MKTTHLFPIVLTALILQSNTCIAGNKRIPSSDLPQTAQAFLKMHFPQEIVTYVEVDRIVNPTYEVWLTDGTKVEFINNGTMSSIECPFTPVPSTIVPIMIHRYAEQRYPGTEIINFKINDNENIIEVELDNGIELKFNKFGIFADADY